MYYLPTLITQIKMFNIKMKTKKKVYFETYLFYLKNKLESLKKIIY